MARIKYLILAAVLFAAGTASAKDKEVYKDPSAPVEARVEDLLGRMTLYEKVAQLSQYTLGRNDNVNNLGEAVSHIPAEIGSLIYFDGNAVLRNAMQRSILWMPCWIVISGQCCSRGMSILCHMR